MAEYHSGGAGVARPPGSIPHPAQKQRSAKLRYASHGPLVRGNFTSRSAGAIIHPLVCQHRCPPLISARFPHSSSLPHPKDWKGPIPLGCAGSNFASIRLISPGKIPSVSRSGLMGHTADVSLDIREFAEILFSNSKCLRQFRN